ncbi:peptidyl-tRNA hydrolase [Pestalotiopsis sp. NC0098]|nr:peptidyl-tRNA hydrolase [Pestalotiopsis sp. NC0098]
MSSVRLFVASLGNPAPYQSSRHSAGHVLLRALQSHLQLPPLKKSKPYAGGLVSAGADVGRPEYTLWQCPGYMNESGKYLLKAYKQFAAETRSSGGGGLGLPGLVVLHDEMETAPGLLKARNGNMSAKGHNGIKSVQQSLQSAGLMAQLTEPGAGGPRFIKVGIGIGRPAGGSREPSAVSPYVLANFSGPELSNLVGSAGSLVTILEDARTSMSD